MANMKTRTWWSWYFGSACMHIKLILTVPSESISYAYAWCEVTAKKLLARIIESKILDETTQFSFGWDWMRPNS